tara:strand:- start:5571 stop:6440 length:870 start_codon:yes stop_codon:yes gene_type:complete
MFNMLSLDWDSYHLGILGRGIAVLGRYNLQDALGAYGGFVGLAEALREINDGEFSQVADQLDAEAASQSSLGSAGSAGSLPSAAAPREIVPPDIHNTFTRLIDDFTVWAKKTGKATGLIADRDNSWDVWFIPNWDEVYEFLVQGTGSASAGSAGSAGSAAAPLLTDPLDIPNIELSFDREAINEQYRDLHKDDTKGTTTGGATVLKQQMDYIATAERAYRLRHATNVRCTLHHSLRREAHGHDVGVFQRVMTIIQDTLKASTPPLPTGTQLPATGGPLGQPGGPGGPIV